MVCNTKPVGAAIYSASSPVMESNLAILPFSVVRYIWNFCWLSNESFEKKFHEDFDLLIIPKFYKTSIFLEFFKGSIRELSAIG